MLDLTVVIIVTKHTKNISPSIQSCIALDPKSVVLVDSAYNERMTRYHKCAHLVTLRERMGDRLTYSEFAPKFEDGRTVLYTLAECSITKDTVMEVLDDMNTEYRSISISNYMPLHTINSYGGSWVLNGVILIYFIIQWMRALFWRFRVDRLPHKSRLTFERVFTVSQAESAAWKLVLGQRGFLDSTVTRLFGSGYGIEPKIDVSSGSPGIVHHHRKCRGGMSQLNEFMQGCHPLGAASFVFSILTLVFWSFSGASIIMTPFSSVGPMLSLYLSIAFCIFVIGYKNLRMRSVLFFSLLFPIYSALLLFMWPYCVFYNRSSPRSGETITGSMQSISAVHLKKFA